MPENFLKRIEIHKTQMMMTSHAVQGFEPKFNFLLLLNEQLKSLKTL